MIRLDIGAPGWLDRAAAAIGAGHVIAFPTDTAYGLGVHPDLAVAAEAVYHLKGRPRHLPLIVLAADAADLADWARWTEPARALARRWWPGPLTLVLPADRRTPPHLCAPDGSVGLRVPDRDDLRALLARTGPLGTTSANRSGATSARNPDAVARAFAGGAEPALLLDGGRTALDADSTVVSLVGPARILRVGAISGDLLGLGEPESAVD